MFSKLYVDFSKNFFSLAACVCAYIYRNEDRIGFRFEFEICNLLLYDIRIFLVRFVGFLWFG